MYRPAFHSYADARARASVSAHGQALQPNPKWHIKSKLVL